MLIRFVALYLFVTVAIGFYGLRLLGIAGRTAVVAGAAAAGVATLAKGPLGLLLPALVVFGFLLSTREWRRLRELFAPLAILAFLVVAAPWYLAILRDQGERFVSVFLLNHNLQRFSSAPPENPPIDASPPPARTMTTCGPPPAPSAPLR